MNACKSVVRTAALLAVALSLGACAMQDTRHAQARTTKAHAVDYEKVAVINHVARKKGVEVHWVNPPYRVD